MNRRDLIARAVGAAAVPSLGVLGAKTINTGPDEVYLHIRCAVIVRGMHGERPGAMEVMTDMVVRLRDLGWTIVEQMLSVEERPKISVYRRMSALDAERLRASVCNASPEHPSLIPEIECIQAIAITRDETWPFGNLRREPGPAAIKRVNVAAEIETGRADQAILDVLRGNKDELRKILRENG